MGKNLPKEVKPENKVDVSILKRRKSIEEYHVKSVDNAKKRMESFNQHKPWKGGLTTVGTKRQRLRSPREFFVNSLRREHIERGMNMRLKHIDEADLKTPTAGEPVFLMLMRNPIELPRAGGELLSKYRLSKMYDGVLVAGSDALARDVHVLGEYVAVLSAREPEVLEIVRQKARYQSSTNDAQPLNNNVEVEKHLGQLGVICVDDIMEIIKMGTQSPLFGDVTGFLLPINLAPPKSETRKRKESKYLIKSEASAHSMASHLSAKYKLN
ncbi:60S ribosomal protein l7-like protein [Perkinsela sp. CCAP 1560/4]|nr:60S ribosomal protein l7-like protein [Perkinsela sp. CCAP 1560/4]|eukprot:KNH06237.1 60S ribosomal protein l7-like protein [Perkinsela sp. CCAP 1560/4]